MDEVTLENYRCFEKEQEVRLAPLTLLVGENSTGKTSFLAMLRALWDVGYGGEVPSFRKAPYDLGTFRDIVHSRSAGRYRTDAFRAGFKSSPPTISDNKKGSGLKFSVEFKKQDADPFPVSRYYSNGAVWFEIKTGKDRQVLRFGTAKGRWEFRPDSNLPIVVEGKLFPVQLFFFSFVHDLEKRSELITALDETSELPNDDELAAVNRLIEKIGPSSFYGAGPYAGAPVRSRPLRIYGSLNLGADPEGGYIPLYLANVRYSDKVEWARLKEAIERFGRDAGLFDGLDVNPFDDSEGGPFQLQIRKSGRRSKGQKRNIADVGYGVSQILPVVTELLRRNTPTMFLLQQPEVHLHPSAQAALGSLFCEIAAQRRTQLIVETHSDHLLERIRLDTRDRRTDLLPRDVSILYFERSDHAVNVHSLALDDLGNVHNAPSSYRQFFMDEVARTLDL